jgi:F0F1-type ATP synthase membrane subunit c/vacuolar-type H+-ATPase subunit K
MLSIIFLPCGSMVVVGRKRLAVLCAGLAVGFACLALGVSFDQMAWSSLFVVCSLLEMMVQVVPASNKQRSMTQSKPA